MSLRPPSLQRQYDEFFSEDPAIIPYPVKAEGMTDGDHKKLADEWRQKLRTARETGQWTPIMMPEQVPARFVMKPMTGTQYRELVDLASTGKIAMGMLQQLAFRCAFVKVVDNSIDAPKSRENHLTLGDIAHRDAADYFDSIHLHIVSELGDEALRRARELDPKS